MWLAGSELFDVHLDTKQLLIAGRDEHALRSSHDSVAEAISALAEWSARLQRRPTLRLWLSGSICKPFLVPILDGFRNGAEKQRAVAALASSATGIAAPCAIWLDSRAVKQARAGVAVESDLVERLVRAVSSTARLVSIRPWWSEILRAALSRRPDLRALSVRDGNTLTWLTGAGNSFSIMRSFDHVHDDVAADALLSRAAMAADIDRYAVDRVSLIADSVLDSSTLKMIGPSFALKRWTQWQDAST